MGKNKPEDTKTLPRNDYVFAKLDDYNTRTHILPILLDERKLKEILSEHKDNPFGMSGTSSKETKIYSSELSRVIDKLRVQPTVGKLALYQLEAEQPFELIELPGVKGREVKYLGIKFSDRASAEHEIFKRRLNTLLISYGYRGLLEEC